MRQREPYRRREPVRSARNPRISAYCCTYRLHLTVELGSCRMPVSRDSQVRDRLRSSSSIAPQTLPWNCSSTIGRLRAERSLPLTSASVCGSPSSLTFDNGRRDDRRAAWAGRRPPRERRPLELLVGLTLLSILPLRADHVYVVRAYRRRAFARALGDRRVGACRRMRSLRAWPWC